MIANIRDLSVKTTPYTEVGYDESRKLSRSFNEAPTANRNSNTTAMKRDSIIWKLEQISGQHLKINFVLSLIMLLDTLVLLFFVPFVNIYNAEDKEDWASVSIWSFYSNKSQQRLRIFPLLDNF